MGKTEGKNHLEDLGVGGRVILILILKECDRRKWAELICLKTGKNRGLFWKWEDTFWDHKKRGIY